MYKWKQESQIGRKGESGFESSGTNRELIMLVLSRKLGEKIVIGDNIVVTVVKVDRNQVRIGIEAPGDIPVYREEIAPTTARTGNASRTEGMVLAR
jgi:carbon storage regulator